MRIGSIFMFFVLLSFISCEPEEDVLPKKNTKEVVDTTLNDWKSKYCGIYNFHVISYTHYHDPDTNYKADSALTDFEGYIIPEDTMHSLKVLYSPYTQTCELDGKAQLERGRILIDVFENDSINRIMPSCIARYNNYVKGEFISNDSIQIELKLVGKYSSSVDVISGRKKKISIL